MSQIKLFAKYLFKQGDAQSTEDLWKEEYGLLGQFKLNDIDGQEYDFAQLNDKVVILTNVACGCGKTTDSYTNLVGLKEEFKDDGFEVVGFPSNSFKQETGDNAAIKEFAVSKFNLNFPLMEKSEVNGENQNVVYEYLKKTYPGDIRWNFSAIFLVVNGKPMARFEKEKFDQIKNAVRIALGKEPPQTTISDATETTTADIIDAAPVLETAEVKTQEDVTAASEDTQIEINFDEYIIIDYQDAKQAQEEVENAQAEFAAEKAAEEAAEKARDEKSVEEKAEEPKENSDQEAKVEEKTEEKSLSATPEIKDESDAKIEEPKIETSKE